ncbi:MAG: ankyrin repeat domain-containing protein [Planctomycetales bacterium]
MNDRPESNDSQLARQAECGIARRSATLIARGLADVERPVKDILAAILDGDLHAVQEILRRDIASVEEACDHPDYIVGLRPLHFVALSNSVAIGARAEMTKLLLAAGADVNSRDSEGATPLHYVDEPSICELLISGGADVNARDNAGATPLHRAAEYPTTIHAPTFGPFEQVVGILVAADPAINAQQSDGQTALHRAAHWGSLPIVKSLLSAGAALTIRDNDGRTPYDVAVKRADRKAWNWWPQEVGNRFRLACLEVALFLKERADVAP